MTFDNWKPAEVVFREFCKANPSLGLAGTRSSWIWFRRAHGPAMEKAGVMRKAINRHLIVDAERFPKVVFDYMTRANEYEAAA